MRCCPLCFTTSQTVVIGCYTKSLNPCVTGNRRPSGQMTTKQRAITVWFLRRLNGVLNLNHSTQTNTCNKIFLHLNCIQQSLHALWDCGVSVRNYRG